MTLTLDYLSRRYRRGIEVVGDAATARLDWDRGVLELEWSDGREVTPADEPVARSYEYEAAAFLRFVRGDEMPPVDARLAAASLGLAEAIRAAGR